MSQQTGWHCRDLGRPAQLVIQFHRQLHTLSATNIPADFQLCTSRSPKCLPKRNVRPTNASQPEIQHHAINALFHIFLACPSYKNYTITFYWKSNLGTYFSTTLQRRSRNRNRLQLLTQTFRSCSFV